MWLVSCLRCAPQRGRGSYLLESGCICKSLLPWSTCWDLFSVAAETNSPVKILMLFKSKSATFPLSRVSHCICVSCFLDCLKSSINRVLSLILLFYSTLVICTLCLSSANEGVMMWVLCCRTCYVQANLLFCAEMNQMLSADLVLSWV